MTTTPPTLQVAAGAAELYTGQLAQIRALSWPGAQQLAADLEYFCNVLAALSVALPADLVTWQARRVMDWLPSNCRLGN